MNASEQNLKEYIIDFLPQTAYSELITVNNGMPHTRPMVYVNDGLIIYMVTKKETTKVEHIKANPNVSVLIIRSFEMVENIKEITVEGKASILDDQAERGKVFKLFESKPKAFQSWAEQGQLDEFDVIRIDPKLIKFFDYSKEDGSPLVLSL